MDSSGAESFSGTIPTSTSMKLLALGYPVRVHYAYSYIREGRRVFRYDNAPHHPEIVTHPHHKHTGHTDRLTPADQPSLSQVLAEVEGWLGR
jgi:hypothetical protein